MLSKETIIDDHRLTFDGGDKLNGSLYIGDDPTQEPGINVALLVEQLRSANLWSHEQPKEVPDEHRQAYKDQLNLLEVITYRDADSRFLISRFDHAKYPSDANRWQQWVDYFDASYKRAD